MNKAKLKFSLIISASLLVSMNIFSSSSYSMEKEFSDTHGTCGKMAADTLSSISQKDIEPPILNIFDRIFIFKDFTLPSRKSSDPK